MKKIILEEGTNTHEARGDIHLVKEFRNGEIIFKGDCLIHHGEHGCIKTTGLVHKINQVEFDPIRRNMFRAYD